MTKLSVNINKVALLRNSRGRNEPDVEAFAAHVLRLGAHGVTLHPRPDQRHARYADVASLLAVVRRFPGAELNVEGNPTPEFLDVVCRTRPDQCTLVPDAPGQLTSDHGWEVRASADRLREVCARLRGEGIRASIFVDYDAADLVLARKLGADRVELYTEPYAASRGTAEADRILAEFGAAARRASAAGLGVNAGHDLSLENLRPFLRGVPGVLEVSIGHALITESLYLGIDAVISRYRHLLEAGG